MSGPLKNERLERYAQNLAKGEEQHKAYLKAGYHGNAATACKAAARVDVRARVTELQERIAQRAVVTAASISERLLGIAEKGEESSEAQLLQVARAALMDVAKLNGLIIDKTQRELSEDQLKLILDTVAATPGAAAELMSKLS